MAMQGHTFKAEFRLSIPRLKTPPPPAVEPLTPVHDGEPLRYPWDNNGIHVSQYPVGAQEGSCRNRTHRDGFAHGRAGHVCPATVITSPARPSTSYPQTYGSPIDTLANAASSLAASPAFAHPSRRSSQAPISPANTSHLFSANGPVRDGFGHHSDERPAKRARSEFFPSPRQPLSASRPMTSHVPSQQFSYNVEQMVDNGTRRYQEQTVASQMPVDMRRISEAQLLLDFHHTAFTTSVSAQSQPPATKGRSIVYAAHSDVSESHGVLITDNLISRRSAHYQDDSVKNGEHSILTSSSGGTVLKDACDESALASAQQTHTPPDDAYNSTIPLSIPNTNDHIEPKKPKLHQGWPKGKPRGPRAGISSSKKRKAPATAKPALTVGPVDAPGQLHSPQSLPAGSPRLPIPKGAEAFEAPPSSHEGAAARERRHSLSDLAKADSENILASSEPYRAVSVPSDNNMMITAPADGTKKVTVNDSGVKAQLTICAGCNFSSSAVLTGESQDWIRCDGCNAWFHFACAGFTTARDVRSVDKYFCRPCKPTHGPTTLVRKSARAHTTVDYAGLNEGVLRTSDETPEHHYIQKFKDGTYQFDKETFARMPPELVTLEYFEKMNAFCEPIVIPASMNPRPKVPGSGIMTTDVRNHREDVPSEVEYEHDDYDIVPDDGQDKLDMVIPQGLTVRRVAEMYGLEERVEVIDVKTQEGEDKRWDMRRWADYYEETGEKIVRNVISLEVSQSKLGRLIRRPKVVRDLDLQDSVWPEGDKANAPKVQFYCLMSVADCYTDFHIDFGGSSVYYHIVKGKKTFFFIPPTKANLKKYEDWCLSPAQNWTFLAEQVKECYRVDLSEGDTMLIPAGWIHAVWTPENSLVIGGNFLTRLNYGMQIRVAEVEKATKVARKFRYPFFQKVLWLTVLKYLSDDPLPSPVANLLRDGKKFKRETPIFCEPDCFGGNSRPGPQYHNARYYCKSELDGLPELASYIWKTVLISLGRIEGITQEVRNAVKRSIPKSCKDPLELAKQFALWVAWKRGNEEIPRWAHLEAILPEAGLPKGDTKLSAAALKKLERKSWSDAFRASRDRPSRQNPAVPATMSAHDSSVDHPLVSTPHVSQRPILENGRHLSTPKTSQLGPKRIACDACRKRRIRCKHKDALTESQKATAISSTILLHTPQSSSRLPSLAVSSGQPIKVLPSDLESGPGAVAFFQRLSKPSGLVDTGAPPSSDLSLESPNNKSGRVKACLECRKSKRRCIHDEYGRVDPIKASEAPVPRGSATKKRKAGEDDSSPASKKLKRESVTALPLIGNIFQQTSPAIDPRLDEASESQVFVTDFQDSITVSRPSALPHTYPVVSSVEQPMEVPYTDSNRQFDPEPLSSLSELRKNGSASNHQENFGPSSPLSDIGQSLSTHGHELIGTSGASILDSIHVGVPRSRADRASSGQKLSQTPRPPSSGRGATPTSARVSKSRRDSKGTIKVEQRATGPSRARSHVETEDQATLRLIRELTKEDYSLRRRSK